MKMKCAALVVAGAMIAPAPALAQGAAEANCPALKQMASIPLTITRDGQSWAAVSVNGIPKLFKLDTAGVTSFYHEAAMALDLPVRRTGATLVDINGNVSNQAARVEGLQLGGIRIDKKDFMVLPTRNPNYARNNRAGFLAMDVLRPYDIEMDFGKGVLNLFSPEHCEGRVVYWQADMVSAIPIRFDSQGKPRVEVKLDGVELSAVLDTGATTTLLNLSVGTTKLGIDLNAPDVQKFTRGNNVSYLRRFSALELNGLTIANPQVTILPDKFRPVTQSSRPVFPGSNIRAYSSDLRLPDLVIGTTILNKLHLYLAVREKKLYVSAAAPVVAPAGGGS